MDATVAKPKSQKNEHCWRGFHPGPWTTSIDVRDFIARNATPYSGDLMKIPYDDLVGVASGATGNPAILVYSTRMAPTERPDIGYAMIFPSMTIVKVIAVQVVGLLFGVGGAT